MSTSRRALTRRKVSQRRRSFLRPASQRRVGHVEALEARSLLAADAGFFVSDYWNQSKPTDVNVDGHTSVLDLLAVVNAITEGGARRLSGSSARIPFAAEGESPAASSPQFYIDPNNDGMVNTLDLIQIINELSAEGEGPANSPLVRLKIVPVVAGTVTPLPQDAQGRYLIQEGDYYELRVLAQDTGLLTVDFDGPGSNNPPLTRPGAFDPDGPGLQLPTSALGVLSVFTDLTFDTSQTQIQVLETQIVELTGNPTGLELGTPTRFTLTFDADGPGGNAPLTTAPIDYSLVPAFTARNIRDALVALSSVGRTSISNLRNVEVEPESSTRFTVRFVNDLGHQNFDLMGATLTNAAGATGVNVLSSVEGNPTDPDIFRESFREMFRGRVVRDQNSPTLPVLNAPLFFTAGVPFLNGERVPNGVNDGGSVTQEFVTSSNRPGARVMDEVQRIRFSPDTASVIEGGTFTLNFGGQITTPITFAGDRPPDAGTGFQGDAVQTALNIQTALRNLSNLGDTLTVFAQGPFSFIVTFNGVDGGIDQPLLALGTNNTTPTMSLSFAEGVKGVNAIDSGLVEVYRLRMEAVNGGGTPVSFVGSVADINTLAFPNTVFGFSAAIPESFIVFDQDGDLMADPAPQLIITEAISALDDAASVNEGLNASVTIDVLGNDIDNSPAPGGPKNLVLVTPLTPIDPAQGTISVNASNQIVYTVPNADFNGVVTFQYTIRDTDNPTITDVGTVTVTVKATNDPPVISAPTQLQQMVEDQAGGLVFSVGNSNAITVNDVDAPEMRVTLTATNGVLQLGSISGLTTVTGNGTGTVQISGPIAALNASLSGLAFTPTLNYSGPATLTIVAEDLGASAHPDNASLGVDTEVININVEGLNDAPVNTVPGPQTTDELVPLVFNSANSNRISVADVDAEASGASSPALIVTLSTSQGGVLTATSGGGATITNNGTTSVTISGTIAQVNAALDGLTYVNSVPANDSIRVLTTDSGNIGAGGPQTDDDTIQVSVLATTRPRAIADVFPPGGPAINEGTSPIFLDVLLNDLVHTGESPILVGSPVPGAGFEGMLTPQAAGMNGSPREHYRYDAPDGDFFGTITFTYTMNETDVAPGDPSDGPSSANVTLTITNVNDDPTANPDNYDTNEDQTLTVNDSLLGVLANDTDPDNRPSRPPANTLTAELVAGSAVGGTVTAFSANGTFTFVPTPNFNGTASFQYRVLDGAGGVPSTGLVTIDVAPVADDPVANPDNYTTPEGTNLSRTAANGLLVNDTDADNLTPPLNSGLTVDVATVTQPAQGSVVVNADGSFTYTLPNSDFDGAVTFTYRVTDGTGRFSPFTTVSIDVTPVNDPPVAGNATYSAVEDQTLNIIQANGLLRPVNPIVTDVDDLLSTLSVEVVSTVPAGHMLVLNSNGSFTYTPLGDFTGQVQFTYRASDEPGSFSNVGTVTINVAEVNDPPTANPDEFTTNEDTPRTITAAELLGDDTDPENDSLTISQVTNFSGPGTLVQNPDGSITFTPAPGFPAPAELGNVTFQYRVTDGPNQSNLATVTITVDEQNDAPIANSYTANDVIKNIPNQQIVPSPLANSSSGQDAGVPGEALVIQSVGGAGGATAQGGVVTTNGTQVFYTPATDFEGFDSFQYTIQDGRGGTATATVTVEVLNFVPKTVGGIAYIDINNNGTLDSGDRRLANVRIELTGSTVVGPYSDFRTTNALGEYTFNTLAPGSYELTQIQPDYMGSIGERVTTSSATLDSVTNIGLNDNKFNLSWNALDFDGNITGLNFLERGIDSAQLANSAGLLGEVLFSSSQDGMIGVTSLAGGIMDWSYALNNWSTTSLCQIQLEVLPNGAIASALLTYNGVTKRIFQDPHRNGTSQTDSMQTPTAGSMARFRILGNSASGEYIIRLDGKLTDFGFVAAAEAPQEVGEGESAPEMSDSQYRQAADAVFAEESWA